MSDFNLRPPDAIDLAERSWSGVATERDAQIYALSTRLLYVANLVEASFEADAQRHGLNSGDMLVLDALFRMGAPYEASPAKLKAHFFISFAGIGKRLARLEARGLIERRANAADRRGQIVRLSEAGLAQLDTGARDNEALHVRALRRMTPQQRRTLADTLMALQDNLEQARGGS